MICDECDAPLHPHYRLFEMMRCLNPRCAKYDRWLVLAADQRAARVAPESADASGVAVPLSPEAEGSEHEAE